MKAEIAVELGKYLSEYNLEDVVVLDLTECNSWTDYFVIGTLASAPQWKGIYRHIKDFADGHNLEMRLGKGKTQDEDIWHLVDLGEIVVHIFTAEGRKFYELDKLWFKAKELFSSKEDESTPELI